MHVSKTLVTILLTACAGAASCLSAVIRGEVADGEGESLPGALVRLISSKDSTDGVSVMTDVSGGYGFENVRPGIYSLRFSMTGMEPVSTDVDVKEDKDTVRVHRIVLSENSVLLDEAVVTAIKAAVVAKEDTLEFNAGSFHTTPNASVEDLLKKLPGVEVGSDGSITSGGKTISKILVDGKEFFADDPKMATKNLPSNMVDKVQVVDRKSETARLTGVDDGEDETVINLTVKKDMNNGLFGTIGAGYGTDSRFRGDANINWFRDGNQVSVIAGGNNVNESGFTDMGRGRFRDFGGNNGINTTGQFGINFNVGKEDKFRAGGNVMYAYTDRDSRSRFDTQYLFPDSVSWLRGGGSTRDRGHSLRANFRMQWNISESDVLDFRPDLQLNYRKSEQRDSSILYATATPDSRVNSNTAIRANRGLDIQTGGRLVYTHKFLSRKGRSFSAQFRYTFSNTREHATTWNDIEYYLRHEESERLFQYLDSKQWSNFVEGRLTWTEPLGNPASGNFLEIAYLASVRFNNADKLTYNLPWDGEAAQTGLPEYTSAPEGAEQDNDLSNRFRNKFTNQQLQVGYKKTTKAMNLNVGFMVSPSSSESEDLINAARNISTRWVWNVSPYLRMRYRFSKNSSLMMNYRARTSQPSLTQLQPVADVSDPLNIKIGNPDLKPTFTQNLGIHFNNYYASTQQSIFAVANASYALNNVVSRTVADPATGVRTTTYANANGNWNVFAMMMLNQPFRNPKWRVAARFNGRYTSNAGYIDGDFNRSGNLVLSPTVGITYSSNIFQMTVTPNYSFQMATSTLAMQADQFTHSYGFDTDASLYLPFGLEISTDLSFAKSTGYSSGFDNTQWLWNAGLSYSLLRDKSLTVSVKAYDLLGERKNISRTVSANMITDRQYNDLGRYVMFGISYKFNTMSKKAVTNIPGDYPGPPPGEGPGDGGGPMGGRPPMMPPPGR